MTAVEATEVTELIGTSDSPSTSTATVDGLPRTNAFETFLHLCKGYIGTGLFSLPWAMSQMGVVGGLLGIFATAYLTSYNCWSIVKLKRYMEKTTFQTDAASETSSNITYPDVGEWAYGVNFQKTVLACICVQQLAVCTVFVSFIGENLMAVLQRLDVPATHFTVMCMTLPFILSLSYIPSLKTLAPVMGVGMLLMMLTFATIGLIVGKEWQNRPDELPPVKPSQVPLALCAMVYSYEGICLILPVESAMEEPRKFRGIFVFTMTFVACLLSAVATISVVTFGNVTSGSLTAYLLEAYQHDETITFWVMAANTLVSLAILLTYPLQLFPAVELMGPALQQNAFLARYFGTAFSGVVDENDLSGFDPLPPLPEHDVASMGSAPSEHLYGLEDNPALKKSAREIDSDVASFSGLSSVTSKFPRMTLPGDSLQLRTGLVLLTFAIAVVVPNVQALISLAGAVAGSSIALIIPPVLELAFIEHMEELESSEEKIAEGKPPPSPHAMRISKLIRKQNSTVQDTKKTGTNKYLGERVKCYLLLLFGAVFICIGTFASVADIVQIYLGK